MASDDDKRLGKYLLKSKLGQGGMGVVYLATDTRLKREVALKVLPKEMASDEAAVKRFLREARAAARLNHPNVVAVYDVDQIRGHCFLVMELVSGCSAAELIAQRPLAWKEATRMIAESCRGLAAAHDAGLVHRDIKPSNIMRTSDGLVKLTDFGLAKAVDDSQHAKNPLTQPGTILGTPHYMSPEQCEGGEVDARSDIYSLGATYFALLTGRPPFNDAQPLQVMYAHCSKPAPDPRTLCPELPAACAAIVMKALAKKRVDRFGSAKEMLASLNDALAQSPNAELKATHSPVAADVGDAATVLTNVNRPVASTVILARGSASRWQRHAVVVGGAAILMGLMIWLWPKLFAPSNPSTASNGSESDSGSPLTSPRPLNLSATESLVFVREWPDSGYVRCIAFSHDGQSLFTGTSNGRLLRWRFDSDVLVDAMMKCPGSVDAVAANARWLFAGGEDKELRTWDLTSSRSTPKMTTFGHKILSLAISPDGQRLAVGTENTLDLYELRDDGPRHLRLVADANASTFSAYMVYGLRFSHDSRWLAATNWTKGVGVWDARTGDLQATRMELPHQLMSVAFLPGDERIVLGTSDKDGLALWDWKIPDSTVRPLDSSVGRSHRSLIVSQQGIIVTLGEWDGPIERYAAADGTRLPILKRSTTLSPVALAASPDGQHLATGGGSPQDSRGFLHLWKVVPKTKQGTR